MSVVLSLFFRLILAGTFLVSGAAKLFAGGSVHESARELGVPARLSGPVATVLPWAEFAAASLLLLLPRAYWGGIGALALLLAFTVTVLVNLLRHNRPFCNCFGKISSERIGWHTFWRNIALCAAAGFLVTPAGAHPGYSAFQRLRDLPGPQQLAIVSGLAALAGVVVLGGVAVQLWKQNRGLRRRLDELVPADGSAPALGARKGPKDLPVGSQAPAFEIPALVGSPLTLTGLLGKGKPVLLLFAAPGCTSCKRLLPDIVQWQRTQTDAFTVAVVSRGKPQLNQERFGPLRPETVGVQRRREVAASYGVLGTPSAVVISPAGRILTQVATGPGEVRDLARVFSAVTADDDAVTQDDAVTPDDDLIEAEA